MESGSISLFYTKGIRLGPVHHNSGDIYARSIFIDLGDITPFEITLFGPEETLSIETDVAKVRV